MVRIRFFERYGFSHCRVWPVFQAGLLLFKRLDVAEETRELVVALHHTAWPHGAPLS